MNQRPTEPKATEWITHVLAMFVLWHWWEYRSLTLIYWVVGFCVVDYFLVKFAQGAMDKRKDDVRREWMLLSMGIKSFMLGLAISTYFWHPGAAQTL
jgi:hypothetical protein